MTKKQIYLFDKWNQMHVEVLGRKIVVRKISTEWGEETFSFTGRSEMMNWAEKYFKKAPVEQTEEEYQNWINTFKEV